MAKDVIITPANGTIEFSDNSTVLGTIYELNGNLYIDSTSNNLVFGDGSPANIEFGAIGTAVSITLLGGGELSSNGNALDIGITGDTINLNVTGVTYNFPGTLVTTTEFTDSAVLTKIKNVDGTGSGLDADYLDGLHAASFARKDTTDTVTGTLTFQNPIWLDYTGTTYSQPIIFRGASASSGEFGIRANSEGLEIYEPEDSKRVWLTFADDAEAGTNAFQMLTSAGMTTILNAANYNNYAPTKTGTGASGTWGISITGNAATATTATTASSVTNGLYTTTNFGGDVSGTYSAIVVADNSHNHTSSNISDATNANTANMIVKRDSSGNFSANIPTFNGIVLSGSNTPTITSGGMDQIHFEANTDAASGTFIFKGGTTSATYITINSSGISGVNFNNTNWDTAYTHTSLTTNPHSTTASQVGLGNVTNESKATMFTSAALTGTPTAPTATAGTSTTQIATTAFVGTAVSNLVASAPAALDTLNELATALGNDPSFSTTITTLIGTKLPLSGGTMTGTVNLSNLTASTILELDSSKNIISATKNTAYNSNFSTTVADIKMNGTQALGSLSTLPRADHVHPTDTTRQAQLNGTGFVKASGTSISYDNSTYSVSTHNHSGVYEPVISAGTTAQYWRGDKSWQTLPTSLPANGGTSDSANFLNSTDSRNDVTTPQSINRGLHLDFKANSTEGLSDGGTYFGELTYRQYGSSADWSGGKSHQLGFTDNDNIWHRSGTSTTWGTWYKLWHSGNFTDNHTNWDAAYTHKSNNGSDHSYINQSVTTTASPTFNTVTANLTGTASYATTAGDADTLDGNHASNFYLATNPNNYTSNTGDITGVTAGNGLTGGGTSGSVTLDVASHAGTAGSIGTVNISADAIGVNLGTTSTTAYRGDYGNLAYTGRIATFTTTGSSGSATFSSNTLNIPTYTLAGLGGEPAFTKNTAFNQNFSTTATDIKMNGTQALGSLSTMARADHVHPVDTSRAATNQTMYIGTTAVAINRGTGALSLTGVSIDGSSASCTGNAATATTWASSRTLTIGSTGKSVNGSANVSWTLAEIGAAATSQTMYIGTTAVAINRSSATLALTGISSITGTNTYDTSGTLTTTSTSGTTLYSTTTSTCFKILIFVSRGSDRHMTEMSIMYDGYGDVTFSEYGDMVSTSYLAYFNADYSSGIRVIVTPTSATSTVFKYRVIAII